MNMAESMKKRSEDIEQILRGYLPKEEGQQKEIFTAFNYSLMAGGKRIRPMIMQETYRMFRKDSSISFVEPFMAAIEMIHTYSLVHDDLPAMDNDQYRRGKLTTHAKFGHAMGILAGDALLNAAFETAFKSFELLDDITDLAKYKELSSRIHRALQILATNAGVYGMIGGQVVDVQNDGKEINKEQLDFIYDLKTGALLRASFLVGAVLAGATKEQLDVVEIIANNVGLAFQIQDDVLDVTSTLEVLGKPIHSDEKNNKTTYVTLYGIDKSKDLVSSLSQKALELLSSLQLEDEFMHKLIEFLITREK
ncbi:MAG: polyprenyl synthetase family protein [Clostridiales bacterium]|nr:polyprenyl synthetase family protein [Clostridiales bacterium]